MAEDTRRQDVQEFWDKPVKEKLTWKGWKRYDHDDLMKRIDMFPAKFKKDISVIRQNIDISDDDDSQASSGSKRKTKTKSTTQPPPAKKPKTGGAKVKPGRVSKKNCEILNMDESDYKVADGFICSVNQALSLAPGYVSTAPRIPAPNV
jgi:hypothetical protein